MTKAAVKAAAEKTLRNFQVTLHLTNGETLVVAHPDSVSYSPDTPEILVWPPGAGFEVVALNEIAKIKVLPAPPTRSRT